MALQHAAVVATGRSDYPNQINNVLAFPGVFRGLLDAHARDITDAMLLAASAAIADVVPEPNPSFIVPSVFDAAVAPAVAEAVRQADPAQGHRRPCGLTFAVLLPPVDHASDRRHASRPAITLVIVVIGVLALQGDVREHLAALAACGATCAPCPSAGRRSSPRSTRWCCPAASPPR